MKNYGDLGGCYPPRPIIPSLISIILHKILRLIHQLLNILTPGLGGGVLARDTLGGFQLVSFVLEFI